MPADPTDADRATGQSLAGHRGRYMPAPGIANAPAAHWKPCSEVGCDNACGGDQRADAIAQALADERERARAPFLALADEIDGLGDMDAGGIAQEIRDIAAQEPTP